MDYNQLLQSIGPYLGAMPNTPVPQQQGQPAPQGQAQAQPQQMQYGMGDILSSPALQGALQGYFGFLAGGGRESIGQRIGQGGLYGLQGMEQARQQQMQLPLMRQQMAQQQAKTGLEQAQATTAQRNLVGLTPDVAQALNQAKADAMAKNDKDYANFINTIESQLRGGLISNEKATESLRLYNEQKRLTDMMKAQAAQTSAGFEAGMMSRMFPGMAPPQPPMGGAGAAPAGGGGAGAAHVYKIGDKATNPATGEIIELTTGGWIPSKP